VLRVMALVGCDVVIIETVGVGQSEVEVARVADLVGVVLAPGAGDSVQMLKAGLMEVGDIFVINKADTAGADALHRALLQALSLAPAAAADRPDVILASATTGAGIPALLDAVLAAGGAAAARRSGRLDARLDVREAVLEAARRRLEAALDHDPARVDAILGGELPLDAAVQQLFAEQLEP
jgi:LAO/AO transport system kinase